MTDQQLLAGIWEAVAALAPALEKHGVGGLVRSYAVGGDREPLAVVQARSAFEASVLATVRAYLAPPRESVGLVAAAVSEPVLGADPAAPTAEVRRAELLTWLGAEYPWQDLRSDDTYVALRASGQLRNVVDAIRGYGGGAEVAELLRSKGVDPAAVS